MFFVNPKIYHFEFLALFWTFKFLRKYLCIDKCAYDRLQTCADVSNCNVIHSHWFLITMAYKSKHRIIFNHTIAVIAEQFRIMQFPTRMLLLRHSTDYQIVNSPVYNRIIQLTPAKDKWRPLVLLLELSLMSSNIPLPIQIEIVERMVTGTMTTYSCFPWTLLQSWSTVRYSKNRQHISSLNLF